MPPERPSLDSSPINLKNLVFIVSFFLQLSVLVWGAAKIDSSVRTLEKTVERLVTDVKTIDELNVRVTVLEELSKRPAKR